MERPIEVPTGIQVARLEDSSLDSNPVAGSGPPETSAIAPPKTPMNNAANTVHMADDSSDSVSLRDELIARCLPSRWSPNPASMVRFDGDADGSGREEFRGLRARLNLVRERQHLQRLLITSAVPAEGKTFIAANLAQAVSWQEERHVLLIDGDLRSSHLHLALGAPSAPGLSDYLNGSADEFAVIKRGTRPNFFFIPGGRPVSNPTELLENGRMKGLMERMASAFDWIIVDAPPVVPIPDAKVIGEMCDGVLIVVRAAHTPFDLAQRAYSEFRGKSFLGVVLNQVEARLTYGYHYYYAKKAGMPSNNGKNR